MYLKLTGAITGLLIASCNSQSENSAIKESFHKKIIESRSSFHSPGKNGISKFKLKEKGGGLFEFIVDPNTCNEEGKCTKAFMRLATVKLKFISDRTPLGGLKTWKINDKYNLNYGAWTNTYSISEGDKYTNLVAAFNMSAVEISGLPEGAVESRVVFHSKPVQLLRKYKLTEIAQGKYEFEIDPNKCSDQACTELASVKRKVVLEPFSNKTKKDGPKVWRIDDYHMLRMAPRSRVFSICSKSDQETNCEEVEANYKL